MKYIDLKILLKNTDSKLLNNLPQFAVKLLSLIIHEKRMNKILGKYREYQGVDFLLKALEELKINIQVEGIENLPENGKCFFVANHPFGLADGMTLLSLIGQKYGDVKAIGNDVLYLIPNVQPMVSYVNVFGKSPKEYFMELENLFRSETPIVHFPAGMVSRKHKGKIQDHLWQKSFISKSVSCQRNVVPVYFEGRNSRLFYTIFSIRKFFRVETNFELSLLPRELFRKEGKTIAVKIGKPIPCSKFDKSKTYAQWAEELRQYVYKMGESHGAVPEF